VTDVVILEDEAPARLRLEAALRGAAPDARILSVHASVAQAVAWFNTHAQPDVVLADIQLADGLSFEIVDRATVTCPFIFCTAFDDYVIDAMTAGGIDYLLKPIKEADLARALGRYRRLEAHFADRVRSVAKAIAQPRRILARRNDGFAALALDRVAYFVVDDKQTRVVTHAGQRYEIDQPLAELEAALDTTGFFRVNRQYLVAAVAVTGFRPFVKGKLLVELAPPPSDHVIVSQENAAKFRDWLRG
jgi:DNA-binding LytR/AlgR family response regulator